jgi:hypothetical protein
MKTKPNTQRVSEYRARQRLTGGTIMSCLMDAEGKAAIETIKYRCLCSKQDAIQMAVKRYAAELTRKR